MKSANRSRTRGMSVLIVLGLLAITLAVSYAMMRTQFTNLQIHGNYQRRGDARQAAYAGLSMALRVMQQPGWAGVASKLTRDVGNGQSFVVTYETGDASLVPGTPEDAEFPYRVTVTSRGLVTDAATAQVISSHTVRGVVQLVRRRLYDPPPSWQALQSFTLYQWGAGSGPGLDLNLPARVEGPVFAGGELRLAGDYPGDGDDVPFAGQIDELVIARRALSDATIRDLARQDTTLDHVIAALGTDLVARWRFDDPPGSLLARDDRDTADGLYEGARPGGPPSAPFGGAGSATFDGYNDHVHLDHLSLDGSAMTLLAWIRPASFPTTYGRIISKTSDLQPTSHDWLLGTESQGSTHRLRFRLRTSPTGTTTLVASSGSLSAGQWTFAAAVFNGTSMRLFQDGVLVASDWKFGEIANSPTKPVSIGNNPPGSPRARLLRDTYAQLAYLGIDRRPLTGPVTVVAGSTSAETRSLCEQDLGLSWNEVPVSGAAPLTHPGEVLKYRLYPGGREYPATVLGPSLEKVTLQPDARQNPLGVCYRAGNLDIRDDVNFTGVLIVDGDPGVPDIEIRGQNVTLQGVTLPALSGDSLATQLPVAIVKDDLRIHDRSGGIVRGAVATWGDCGFRSGSQEDSFAMQGKFIVQRFYAQPRDEWIESPGWWNERTMQFLDQLASSTPQVFLPDWLAEHYGLDPTPKLTVSPDPAAPRYHWPNWEQPVFAHHPDDAGLRWTVLEVREAP